MPKTIRNVYDKYLTFENLDWCKSQSQLPELLFV